MFGFRCLTHREESLARSRTAHIPVWRFPSNVLDHAVVFDAQHIDKRFFGEEGLQCIWDLMCLREVDVARALIKVTDRKPLGNRLADRRGGRHDLVDIARLRAERCHDEYDRLKEEKSPM